MVNLAFVDAFWKAFTESPLGRDLKGSFSAPRVVGVVSDVWPRADSSPQPTAYLSFSQFALPTMTLVVRAQMRPADVIGAVQSAIWEVDPDQPRPSGVSLKSRFRHYLNLNRTVPRLSRLLGDFRWDRMDRVFPNAA